MASFLRKGWRFRPTSRLVIELVNKGQSPAEFESKQLRKEKVLAPESTVTW